MENYSHTSTATRTRRRLIEVLREMNWSLEGFQSYLNTRNINVVLNPNERVNDRIKSYLMKYVDYISFNPVTITENVNKGLKLVQNTADLWRRDIKQGKLADIMGREYLRTRFNFKVVNNVGHHLRNRNISFAEFYNVANTLGFVHDYKLTQALIEKGYKFYINNTAINIKNGNLDFDHARELLMDIMESRTIKDVIEELGLSMFEIAMIFNHNQRTYKGPMIRHTSDYRIFITEYNYLKYYKEKFIPDFISDDITFEIYQLGLKGQIIRGFSYDMELPKMDNENDEDYLLGTSKNSIFLISKF